MNQRDHNARFEEGAQAMAEQFSDLEAILAGVLGSLSEPTLWGWNARPNGAFLVITEEDAEKVMVCLEGFFENKWNEQTLANADAGVLEVVNYLSGIRERQYLFTKRIEDDLMLYGAFWPWATSSRVSVRVSAYALGQRDLNPQQTQALLTATLAANDSVSEGTDS